MKTEILLNRTFEFYYYVRDFRIYLDGKPVGRLKSGEDLSIDVSPGTHVLQVKVFPDNSRKLTFTIAEGESLLYMVGTLYGKSFKRDIIDSIQCKAIRIVPITEDNWEEYYGKSDTGSAPVFSHDALYKRTVIFSIVSFLCTLGVLVLFNYSVNPAFENLVWMFVFGMGMGLLNLYTMQAPYRHTFPLLSILLGNAFSLCFLAAFVINYSALQLAVFLIAASSMLFLFENKPLLFKS